MTADIDVFFSFRSPYSFLAAQRLNRLCDTWDVNIALRPVYPIAVRIPGFFKTVNPKWVGYVITDVAREAERLGLTIAMPDPDPVVMNFETGDVAAEQPYIERLTMLAAAASEAGAGMAFAEALSTLIWSGENWLEDGRLDGAARVAGLNLNALETAVAERADHFADVIAANEAALDATAHWGVPTMTLNGETFHGQDRIGALEWRLGETGVART